MKSCISARGWMAAALILVAAAVANLSSSAAIAQTATPPATQPGATTQPAPPATAPGATTQPDQQAFEAWRVDMARRPVPKTGCFNATFPRTEWQEIPCGRPSPVPNQSGSGARRNQVGNTADYVAKTSGLISSATGSFISPTSASGETGNAAQQSSPYSTANIFTLQLNTQSSFSNDGSTFSSAACNGIAGCFAWQQAVFSQTQGPAPGPGQVSAAPGAPVATTPALFIEYWLFGVGWPCPAQPVWTGQPPGTLWNQDSSFGTQNCWFNGPAVYVPPQSVASLTGIAMTMTASATQDQISLTTPGGAYAYAEPNVLSLAQAWTEAEFNIFGDCCLADATFASPAVLVVKTSINDGTTNAPTCVANDGTTGETNNLSFVPTAAPVCCPYGGGSPAIEFMEADSGPHNAWCGPTRIEGDPHLTTADGAHYDFQGAGEFITFRDPDGTEIQTRQTPISTTFFPAPDKHDGLATCVSINTAVAARVGRYRVTWEPNLSGVPDPRGLELRIDGVLTTLGAHGVALGAGGRVAPAPGGALQIDFPGGKTLLVTPQWWADQGKWFLNVDISNLGLVSDAHGSSGRGIAGAISSGSWLPALPDGASVGPMPTALAARYSTLYTTFADAWRVTDRDTLFDYAPGTSTNTFTNRDWPKQSAPCTAPDSRPTEPASEATAAGVCRRVRDENRRADCLFDVRATGNLSFAKTYADTERLLAFSTTTSLTGGEEPSQPGEWVTFTALVAPSASTSPGLPSGAVQFAVDGANVAELFTVDAKGRATFETSHLKVGSHRVTARYVPGTDSAFLPSASLERVHVVRRCPCGDTQPK